MENSLSDYIKVIENTVNKNLVSPVYLSLIKNITDIFPSQITSMFGFECRLDKNKGDADFAFSIQPDMADLLRIIDFEEKFWPENIIWKRVSNLVNSLDEPDLKDLISIVWLEFDMKENVKEIPLPGVFISFEKYLRKNRVKLSKEDKIKECFSISEKVLSSLRGRTFFEKIKPAFIKLLRLLPERAMLFQVGTMLSRPGDFIRICITPVTPEEIIHILKEMNWPGSSYEFYEILKKFSSFGDPPVLALDLGETVLEKAGIEISFFEDMILKGEPKWKDFLNYLIEENLSTEEKAEALLTYPGYILERPEIDFWPRNLREASIFCGKSIFINKLDHFKIVYQKDCPLEAKAYLAVHHQWIK